MSAKRFYHSKDESAGDNIVDAGHDDDDDDDDFDNNDDDGRVVDCRNKLGIPSSRFVSTEKFVTQLCFDEKSEHADDDYDEKEVENHYDNEDDEHSTEQDDTVEVDDCWSSAGLLS